MPGAYRSALGYLPRCRSSTALDPSFTPSVCFLVAPRLRHRGLDLAPYNTAYAVPADLQLARDVIPVEIVTPGGQSVYVIPLAVATVVVRLTLSRGDMVGATRESTTTAEH